VAARESILRVAGLPGLISGVGRASGVLSLLARHLPVAGVDHDLDHAAARGRPATRADRAR
jgi:hypothetical protein